MRKHWLILANFACALALSAGEAYAAPAVAPLAGQAPAKAALEANPAANPAAKSHSVPKRSAVHNPDALDLGGKAEVVGNYELGASVGGSDVPGGMNEEIEDIVNKITKPPAPKKGIAPAPAKVPETALPRKSSAPAPVPVKKDSPPPPPSPARSISPAVPAGPSGETGGIGPTDHAMISAISPLSPAISKIELAALAASLFPRPPWRTRAAANDAAAYFELPRGI